MSAEFLAQRAAARGDDDVDLGGLRRLIVAKRKWIIGLTLTAFLGSLAFVNLVTPVYTGEAVVLLEVQDAFAPRTERTDPSGGTGIDNEAVNSQIQLISSRDIGLRVIRKLNLVGDPEFDPLANGPGFFSSLLATLKLKRDPLNVSPEDRAMETFSTKLNVWSPPKTRVIDITFKSSNPEMAKNIANAIADSYLEFQAEAKRDIARKAAASLSTLVVDLKKRVAEAEAKSEEFRAQSGLYMGANNSTVNGQQLSEVNTDLSRARAVQADAQAKARLIREMLRQGRLNEVPDIANNDLVRRISEQRISIKSQLAMESRTLLSGHPRIQELNAQLAGLESELRMAADKTARTLENEARIAGARVENLTALLNSQKKVIGDSASDEVQMRDYERSARLLKDELEATTTKYQEALAAQNSKSTTTDARVISNAVAPQLPTFPKKIPIVSFVTLASLILSLGSISAYHLLTAPAQANNGQANNDSASGSARREPEILDEKIIAPTAEAAISPQVEPPPPHQLDANAYTLEGRAADEITRREVILSHAAQAVREAIALADNTACLVVALMSDGMTDDGFALTAARRISKNGRAIFIALGDSVRTPYIPDVGLSDLIKGKLNFGDAIHRDRATRLHFMSSGNAPIMDAEGLAIVLDALSETYEFVIIGAGHELSVENASIVAERAHYAAVFAQDSESAWAMARAFEDYGGVETKIFGDEEQRVVA